MGDIALIHADAARNGGIVSIDECRRAGFRFAEVAAKCRAGKWSRLARGIYLVNADLCAGPSRGEMIRAAVASFGPSAVAGLHTAAEIHGIGGAPPARVIHIVTPRSMGRGRRVADAAIRAHQIDLREDEVTVVDGIPVTSAGRTLMDLACDLDRFSAASAADCALNRGRVTGDEIAAVLARLRGRRGAVIARQALAEADGRAESPLETRVRLRAADGKVAPDQLQFQVRRSDGSFVARCDFAWTRDRVVGEADGIEPHSTPDALLHDRDRQEALMALGYRVIRFTWADTIMPETVPQLIRAARAAAVRSAAVRSVEKGRDRIAAPPFTRIA